MSQDNETSLANLVTRQAAAMKQLREQRDDLLTALRASEDALVGARFSVSAAVKAGAVAFAACDNPVINLDHELEKVRAAIRRGEVL